MSITQVPYRLTAKAGIATQAPVAKIQPGDVVSVRPLPGNTKAVYIGLHQPEAALSGARIELEPYASAVTISVDNLADLYLLTQVDNEGIQILRATDTGSRRGSAPAAGSAPAPVSMAGAASTAGGMASGGSGGSGGTGGAVMGGFSSFRNRQMNVL